MKIKFRKCLRDEKRKPLFSYQQLDETQDELSRGTARISLHMLIEDENMTLSEIVSAHEEHDQAFPDAPFSYPVQHILRGLSRLIELHMVDVYEGID
jgi:hypothetical protein